MASCCHRSGRLSGISSPSMQARYGSWPALSPGLYLFGKATGRSAWNSLLRRGQKRENIPRLTHSRPSAATVQTREMPVIPAGAEHGEIGKENSDEFWQFRPKSWANRQNCQCVDCHILRKADVVRRARIVGVSALLSPRLGKVWPGGGSRAPATASQKQHGHHPQDIGKRPSSRLRGAWSGPARRAPGFWPGRHPW